MNKMIYESHAVFHPGYYVQEMIDDIGVERTAFAKRLHVSDQMLRDLISGDIDLSANLATRLSEETGVSVETWLNLQERYKQHAEMIEHRKEMVS